MRINLLINYGGRTTDGTRILPGEYDADDPRLFGLASYLVENGHAVVVADTVVSPSTLEPASDPDEDPRITALRAIAESEPDVLHRLYYIGSNPRAHSVKVDGVEYAVPKEGGGDDDQFEPRAVDVLGAAALQLIARGTFALEPGRGA